MFYQTYYGWRDFPISLWSINECLKVILIIFSFPLAPFDFSVEGVTSMSADTHKVFGKFNFSRNLMKYMTVRLALFLNIVWLFFKYYSTATLLKDLQSFYIVRTNYVITSSLFPRIGLEGSTHVQQSQAVVLVGLLLAVGLLWCIWVKKVSTIDIISNRPFQCR